MTGQPALLDKDAAQAVLAHYLMMHEKRDIVILQLRVAGKRWATGTTGPDREFFFFTEEGKDCGWYVHRDDSSIEPDDCCPKSN